MVWAPLPAEQRQALLDEVDRFARGVIAPRAARPEAPMDPETLGAVLGEAEALGLPGSTEEPTGLAPWDGLLEGAPVGTTLELLERLARSSVAVGYAVHQRALARALIRAAGWPAPNAPAVAPEGAYGLGRDALPRMLQGHPPEPSDAAILDDIYGASAARVVSVDPAFDALITPVRAAHGGLEWQMHPREGLELRGAEPAHGLDELRTCEVAPRVTAPARSDFGPARAAEVAAAVIAAHQLALTALAAGTADRAVDLAAAFAAERWQGGARIERHPAVRTLIGRARGAVRAVRTQLDAMARRRLGDPRSLGDVLALRAASHPALADAANDALQVFGGAGYMQDTGLEKIVRDVNHLRCFGGSPTELAMIAAELERAHA